MKDPTLVWALWGATVAQFGLLSAVVRAILKGTLVPRSGLDDVRADRDKWEAACTTKDQSLDAISGRLEANTEALRLMQALMDALVARGPAR